MKIQFKRAVTVAIGLLAASSAAIAPAAAQASVRPAKASAAAAWECAGTHYGNRLIKANGIIFDNQFVCAGNYEWIVQPDGNFVEYLKSKLHVVWASKTVTYLPSEAVMQPGGNFVLEAGLSSSARWSTNTNGHPGAYVCFQIDGNLVVYANNGRYDCAGKVLYANGH